MITSMVSAGSLLVFAMLVVLVSFLADWAHSGALLAVWLRWVVFGLFPFRLQMLDLVVGGLWK